MPLTAVDPSAGGVYDYAAMAACGVDYFVPMAYQQQYGKTSFATGSIRHRRWSHLDAPRFISYGESLMK